MLLTRKRVNFILSDDLPTGAGAFLLPALFYRGSDLAEPNPITGIFCMENEVKKVAFVRPLLRLKQISVNLPSNKNRLGE